MADHTILIGDTLNLGWPAVREGETIYVNLLYTSHVLESGTVIPIPVENPINYIDPDGPGGPILKSGKWKAMFRLADKITVFMKANDDVLNHMALLMPRALISAMMTDRPFFGRWIGILRSSRAACYVAGPKGLASPLSLDKMVRIPTDR